MKKLKEIADMIVFILPLGWLMACLDGAWVHFEENNLWRFLLSLVSACVIAFLLVGLGSRLSGYEIEPKEDSRLLHIPRIFVILIELVVLAIVSSQI